MKDIASVPENIIRLEKHEEEERELKKTQTEILIELASKVELFQTPDKEVYARIPVKDHYEVYNVLSKSFKNWLIIKYYEIHTKPPNKQSILDTIGYLESKAMFEGTVKRVFVRVASTENAIYIDLGDDTWRAVEITTRGWRVTSNYPVCFKRTGGMAALPNPTSGGNIEELRQFINCANERVWRSIVAWLLSALRSNGPFPLLIIQGEQGSAKSTTTKILRSLIDPSSVPLCTAPKNEQDLIIRAYNTWVLALDNLSGLYHWVSDALCRLSTGGGFATRSLFTNDEEKLFYVMRPAILNGIDDIATRQDLLDRTIVIYLKSIPEELRRDEASFWKEFEAAKPRILGALYTLISSALRNLPGVKLKRLPRMADFVLWITAAETTLGWEPNSFQLVYEENRKRTIEVGLESDPVAMAILELAENNGEWTGTATELVECLSRFVPHRVSHSRKWPTNRSIKNRLTRLNPALKVVGIEVETFRANNGRMFVIRKIS
ncbi:hypothetical protein [Alkaliphilus transvaalensis]|uniref:hypothetical protein n=1 Tax=Alkaliphilus transvaalensis TaxID=114628 RepID=UPI0006868DCF|nr:hypothetical protein [Alkaliphilus transvaalensis]